MPASPFGYHYYSEYQQCPRRWYLHHELSLNPLAQKPALTLGLIWHEALELLLQTSDLPAATAHAVDAYTGFRSEIPKDVFDEKLALIPKRLAQWWENYQTERAALPGPISIIATEMPLSLELFDGTRLTGRIDGILQTGDGLAYLLEHKTTSYRMANVINSLELEDQVTAYLLLFTQCFPDTPVAGALVDVTGFYLTAPEPEFTIIARTDTELFDYSCSLRSLSKSIGESKRYFSQDENPFYSFPRNGSWCSMFGCPYTPICREHLELRPEVFKDPQTLGSFGLVIGEQDEDQETT